MLTKYTIIFIFSLLIASFSQVLLKISANNKHESIIYEYLNCYVIFGYTLFLGCLVLNSFAYKGIQLKHGAALESFGYIFILILDRLVFKHKITKNKIIGSIIIMFGLLVFFY